MSLFASLSLARRIESAEAHLSDAVVRLVAARRPDLRAFSDAIAGGVAVFGGPGSPFNKLIGAGFDGAPDEARLAEIERAFLERGAPLQAEVSTLASPAFHGALTRRGYVLEGFENVLGLGLAGHDPAARSGSSGAVLGHDGAGPSIDGAAHGFDGGRRAVGAIDVTECTAAEFDTWLDVVVTGFEHPDATGAGSGVPPPPRDALVQVMSDMAGAPRFHRYLARIGGVPVGGASMRLDESGVAQLAGAATLPDCRRRGVQRALLDARLEVARRSGCDLAVITTQPGTQSQANAQRHGFELLYARAVLVKSADRPPATAHRPGSAAG